MAQKLDVSVYHDHFKSVAEVALIYRYTERHVRMLCDTGKIEAKKSGGIWIIYVPSVNRYLGME